MIKEIIIKQGEKIVKQGKNFIYVGSHIENDGGAQTDVGKRVQKTKRAFCKLKNVLRSNRVHLKTEMKIFNA